ncbi:MAG: septal ring lytic transglycosylase RlpA family protein [Thermodesulfobacteriota bacterium]|nr:septal ring lytic transglycosylase RlpA family protein [Thermodesulfobacteriota bacterium]
MKKTALLLPILCLLVALHGCSSKTPDQTIRQDKATTKKRGTQRPYVIKYRTYYPIPSAEGYSEKGLASWYGKKFHGRKTANGETYDMYGHTAAHKTLPMNTMLLVKNLSNSKSTVVRINDRGPFVRKRIIDLTYTAAKELDIIRNGTARVTIVALGEEVQKPAKPLAGSRQSRKLVHQDFDKGKFYIQVGAFEYIKNARELAGNFAEKGRDVIIQQFPAAGISLYRVMVYSGTSLKLAREHETYLEQNGFPNALVIARDKG